VLCFYPQKQGHGQASAFKKQKQRRADRKETQVGAGGQRKGWTLRLVGGYAYRVNLSLSPPYLQSHLSFAAWRRADGGWLVSKSIWCPTGFNRAANCRMPLLQEGATSGDVRGCRLCCAPRGFDAVPVGITASGTGEAVGLTFLDLIPLPLSDLPLALYLSLNLFPQAAAERLELAREQFLPARWCASVFPRAPP
jgi:hypothetical protein